MRPNRILLLGGTDRLLRKAEGLDLDIANIRTKLDLGPVATRVCSVIREADMNDVGSVTNLARQMHADNPFQRIICHSEPLQMLAGHLSTSLGIPGNSFESVKVLRDKYALRNLLRLHGLSSIAADIVKSREELLSFVDKQGGAVVKPRSGGGSVGVHFVRSLEEAEKVWRWAKRVGLSEMLAEEFMEGTEVSLEFFSVDGTHVPIAATSKEFSEGFVELGHAVPAPLTAQQFDDASRLVTSVLEAVAINWGPSHTEIIFTEHGPELVESHSRRAGGHINELVSLVHGIDMEQLAFQLAAGEEGTLLANPVPTQAAAIRFLTSGPGEVTGVHGVSEVADCPDVEEVEVYVSPGEMSRGLQWSGDYAGHVIARGETAAEAMRNANHQASLIRIETDRGDGDVIHMTEDPVREERAAFDAFDESMAVGN